MNLCSLFKLSTLSNEEQVFVTELGSLLKKYERVINSPETKDEAELDFFEHLSSISKHKVFFHLDLKTALNIKK